MGCPPRAATKHGTSPPVPRPECGLVDFSSASTSAANGSARSSLTAGGVTCPSRSSPLTGVRAADAAQREAVDQPVPLLLLLVEPLPVAHQLQMTGPARRCPRSGRCARQLRSPLRPAGPRQTERRLGVGDHRNRRTPLAHLPGRARIANRAMEHAPTALAARVGSRRAQRSWLPRSRGCRTTICPQLIMSAHPRLDRARPAHTSSQPSARFGVLSRREIEDDVVYPQDHAIEPPYGEVTDDLELRSAAPPVLVDESGNLCTIDGP
jgi:hypothetical protein